MKEQKLIAILTELGEILENKDIMLQHYKREAEALKQKLQEIEKKEEQRQNGKIEYFTKETSN